MGIKYCCQYGKNPVDNDNEVVTQDPNDAIQKLKHNLIPKEKSTDFISMGMPGTAGSGTEEIASEKEHRLKHINNNIDIPQIKEKLKKKKKKKDKKLEEEEERKRKEEIEKAMKEAEDEELKKQEEDLEPIDLNELTRKDPTSNTERVTRSNRNDKFFLRLGMANRESNYLDRFHAEVYLSNYGNVDSSYELLGSTEEQNSHSQIGFSEGFEIEYNFEKCQYLKIVYFNSDEWRSEIIVNLALVITEQAPEFSVPINFYRSEKIIVTRKMLKQELKNFVSYAKIKFVRDAFTSKEEEHAFFVEFNYISMAFVAKKLYYKIFALPQKQVTGEKVEIFCSSERYGKSPIYFNPAYILKKFLQRNLPIYFEFYDKSGVIGDYILDKRSYINDLRFHPIITHIYDNQGVNFGDVKISIAKMANNHFLDYLNHGLDINFIIGIDYTSSNKDPMQPNSLHTLVGEGKNIYEKAIRSCGNILSFYDKSQLFPVFGFGGIPKAKNALSHCFNVNGTLNPNITGGLENVIKIYKESLKTVKLLGPTKISEVIKTVLEHTIRFRNLQEEDEKKVMSKSKTTKDNINQLRGLIRDTIKVDRNASPKKKTTQVRNMSTPPRTSVHMTKKITTAKDAEHGPTFSPSRKPFKCPSLQNLHSPKNDDSKGYQRSGGAKKTIRNSIFQEAEEIDPVEERNFIIPRHERKYSILLIVTDGKIDDMPETKNILVQASNYPISVIIVGVGENNFGNMIELQSESRPIENVFGQKRERNIVQFVEFSKFSNNETLLAEKVLEKIPKQIEEYYRLNGI